MDTDATFYQRLGQWLQATRKAKGLSQTDVADALGVSFQAYQKYENATVKIRLDKAVAVARLFGTTLNKMAAACAG